MDKIGVDGESYVNVRGERVEDLVGAHMAVGVDDTLTAALHIARYERGIGAMAGVRVECALATSNVGCVGERFLTFERATVGDTFQTAVLLPRALRPPPLPRFD